MDSSLLFAAGVAGAAYVITPGPAVLALLGIGASQGRGAGARFLGGHMFGDLLWSGLALVAIIGAQAIGTFLFDVLGLFCGGYLFWLGWRAVRARRTAEGTLDTSVGRPLIRGLAFGVTNPKSYPVAVATFTALLGGHASELTWASMPMLLGAAFLGFLAAYAVLLAIIGAATVRRVYRRYELWITRASGVMFIGFALHAVLHAMPGLMPKRA
ncbi:MAG TPA: LysE family translocator [Aliidongia sp.]|uniref:LysE family translocator n=1 Tax=Aliidongia sp. TaxID=1914230 RepID=UPI002DDD71E5|nr:LysE family translocator [Aliidongia sp.]HEV2673421.1 LysE family translocator [Aliidongia sp.]